MARVLVTGATGFVGSNVMEVLAMAGHDPIGGVRSVPEGGVPWKSVVIDYAQADEVDRVFEEVRPDAVVHCAISNDFTMLDRDRQAAFDAYVGMTTRVTRAAAAVGAHVVYVSSDWVLDGSRHMVPEDEPPNPVNIYGVLKALSEQVVRDLAPDGAIVRISGVTGMPRVRESGPRAQDVGFGFFVATLITTLSAGQRFAVWEGDGVNLVATPSLASDIGWGIERMVSDRIGGSFALVSANPVNRISLAELAAETFDLDASLIERIEAPLDQRFPAPVPVDTSMSSERTRETLRLPARTIEELLAAFRRERETGRLEPSGA